MQVTLLRDSKGRFGFAVGVEAAGVVITKIAPSDALPLPGMTDERDKMHVRDIVLSVGAMPLVNERGLPERIGDGSPTAAAANRGSSCARPLRGS